MARVAKLVASRRRSCRLDAKAPRPLATSFGTRRFRVGGERALGYKILPSRLPARQIHMKQAYKYFTAQVKASPLNTKDPSLRFVARDDHPGRMFVLPH